MAGKITDLRKNPMMGTSIKPGNCVLIESTLQIFIWTDQGFFNIMTGTKFPYSYSELTEVRDVVLHDDIVHSLAYLAERMKPR